MVNQLSLKTLEKALDSGIKEKICVQVWLGHGETLFIGFGEKILPPTSLGRSHPLPPCELQTHFADWRIENDQGVFNSEENGRLQGAHAVHALVGSCVVGWNFLNLPTNLLIRFEGNVSLHVISWPTAELKPDELEQDAWVLRMPDGKYLAVSCSGRIVSEDTMGR